MWRTVNFGRISAESTFYFPMAAIDLGALQFVFIDFLRSY